MPKSKHTHDHDHDHDHEEDQDGVELITVVDEEGREHDFELFTVLTVGSKEYAVLFPFEEEESDEEGEAVILRLEKDEDGEDILLDIDDEGEWNEVVKAWEAFIGSMDEEV